MKRLLPFAVLIGVVVLVIALVSGGGTSSYRVAAVFDVAQGIDSGQQVKIAGVVVGHVDAVVLVPGPKAKIVMDVDRKFAPFKANATCTILPEGLISENFVSCDAGTASSAPLATEGGMPTVPVSRTSVPASLQQLLDVFAMPTDDRLRVLVDELGVGTAGEGENLNSLLRRSNPALTQAQRVLSIVDAQRDQLATAVQQTNRVLASVNNGSARTLVHRVADVARTMASRQPALQSAIGRLPTLLTALKPGLRSVDRVLANGTPLLVDLQAAAPRLQQVTHSLPTFLSSATPALHGLASASEAAHPAIRAATPVVRDVNTMSAAAAKFSTPLDLFLNSTRDTGGLDGLNATFYTLSAFASAYDGISHLGAIVARPLPQCIADPATTGCSGDFNSPGKGTIPANDPACGPHQGALWDPPTNCQGIEFLPLAKRPHTSTNVARSNTSAAGTATSAPATTPPALQQLVHFLLGK